MRKTLTLFLFVTILCLPFLSRLLMGDVEIKNTENRVFATRPEVKNILVNDKKGIHKLTFGIRRYCSEYEAYYNDNFILKNRLNQYNAKWLKGLNTTSSKFRVIPGKEGWLFVGDQYGNGISEYLGTDTFTASQLDRIVENERAKKAFCEAHNLHYFLILPPDKTEIYPEYFPLKKKVGQKSKYDQLTERLKKETDLNFIDLKEALIAAKEDHQVYYRTDTHWNAMGAFTGYVELMRAVKRELPDLYSADTSEIEIVEFEIGPMDLSQLIASEEKETTEIYSIRSGFPLTSCENARIELPQYMEQGEQPVRFVNPTKLGKSIIFGDSFAEALLYPYTQSLQEVILMKLNVFNNPFDKESILREMPQIVISEVVGRDIDALLEDVK